VNRAELLRAAKERAGDEPSPPGPGLHRQGTGDGQAIPFLDPTPELDHDSETGDGEAADTHPLAADSEPASRKGLDRHLDLDAAVGEELEEAGTTADDAHQEVGVEDSKPIANIELADEMHRAVAAAIHAEAGVDFSIGGLVEALPDENRGGARPESGGKRAKLEPRAHREPGRVSVEPDDRRMDLAHAVAEDLGKKRPGIVVGDEAAIAEANSAAVDRGSGPGSTGVERKEERGPPVAREIPLRLSRG
jgi:hypothetical protein